MVSDDTFEEINEAKSNMNHIYDQSDPREYFSELRKHDYVIPDGAKPIFQELIANLRQQRKDNIHILDLGCSYGVNAAMLKHDLSMPELYDHWCDDVPAKATSREVVEADRRYFSNLDEQAEITVTGFDQANSAITFGEKSGLLDVGLAINLETDPLPNAATENLAQVDLVISTGCVGYLTEKSFERLLPALTQGQSPWIGNFVLQMFPFDAIEETLDDWGYETEKLEGQSFIQRDFVSAEEKRQVFEQLRSRGIDPETADTNDQIRAEFYLSRPASEVAAESIQDLLTA
jgi:SAM-dependent methyltransferase